MVAVAGKAAGIQTVCLTRRQAGRQASGRWQEPRAGRILHSSAVVNCRKIYGKYRGRTQ